MSWRAAVLTLFPEMFPGPLGLSLAGRALERGDWSLQTHNLRDHGLGRHRAVDDTPFGGGAGLVMRPDVVDAALSQALPPGDRRAVIYLTPRGRRLTQADAGRYAEGEGVVLLCGRYEGIDERVLDARGIEQVSIGDYVLSGGEPAALVLLDSVVRLLPGVMGSERSGLEESFADGLLEYPHYTKPADWQGRAAPEMLLSGNHAAIAAWRRAAAEADTRARRPDLWEQYASRTRFSALPITAAHRN
ncbi:tRNA (guanosine(37)-N1)-methyltransferase TrmD [Lichenicoccus sp.]|uniref:tRNA (guanosine(37)-N1)-methyltransferase TrmD n=1 Tax=Lichenicoccus sp. TaxID=2781899 RepID=UPI003D0F38D2